MQPTIIAVCVRFAIAEMINKAILDAMETK